jgi:hypothetical protein
MSSNVLLTMLLNDLGLYIHLFIYYLLIYLFFDPRAHNVFYVFHVFLYMKTFGDEK